MPRFLWVVLWLVLPGVASADPTAPARPLNVLFLMSDDMRPDLGSYGHPIVKSPNIDALAAAGVRFDRAYCQYPLCNPSRASMLTGRHVRTTGVWDNTVWFGTAHPDFVSMPRHFKQNGYVTLRAGKIFHGGIDDIDAWTEGAEKRRPEAAATAKRPTPAERARTSDRIVVLEGDGQSHNDYKTADQAIEYLRKHKDKPFFLACGMTKPHSPPTAPAKFFDLYDDAKIPLPATFAAKPTVPAGWPDRVLTPNGDLFIQRDASEAEARKMIEAYYASISFADWNIGRVIAELDKLGLRQNTVIVFWGDHGYHLGEHGKWSKHGSLLELGTRVPLIIAAPSAVKSAGKPAMSPVQSLDIYPTLCELTGVKPPAGLEGKSLVPLLADPATPWTAPAVSAFGNKNKFGVAVRTGTHRYIEWDNGAGGVLLFDVVADPQELKNLAGDPTVAKVQAELAAIARAHAPKP